MKKFVVAGLVLASSAPGLAQVIDVGCADLVSTFRTAPAGATLVLTEACQDFELSSRTAPLTIMAGTLDRPVVVKGLRLRRVENLTWIGGQMEAIAGQSSTNHILGRAISVAAGRNIVFDGMRVREAHRGFVAHDTHNLTVRNSSFTRMRSDGMNLVSIIGATITGNSFAQTNPRPTTCTLPDGSVLFSLKQSTCERTHKGVWRDGDHSDCIQIWGTPSDIRVEGNSINAPSPGWCMGITTHGITRGTRIQILNNHVRTDHSKGIFMNACDDCVIRGNRVEVASSNPFREPGISLGESNGAVQVCGNVVPSLHRNEGEEPCAI